MSTAEVHTNTLAAYISAGRPAEVPGVLDRLKISGRESFDIAFNKACSILEAGDYAAAEAQLLLAVRLGVCLFLPLPLPSLPPYCRTHTAVHMLPYTYYRTHAAVHILPYRCCYTHTHHRWPSLREHTCPHVRVR